MSARDGEHNQTQTKVYDTNFRLKAELRTNSALPEPHGPGALEDAVSFLKNKTETQTRFERVSSLVEGFESPFGLELLATVHWVATREPVKTVNDVATSTYAWNDRKKQYSRRQIALAVDVLTRKGWIDIGTSDDD